MIINAIEAIAEKGEITLSTRQKGDSVLLSIADTGDGMTDETKRRIFDPFFTTKGPQGSGLGLSIAYGIISRHKGKIIVASEKWVGTTFIIKLPVAIEAERVLAPTEVKEAKILVTEKTYSIV